MFSLFKREGIFFGICFLGAANTYYNIIRELKHALYIVKMPIMKGLAAYCYDGPLRLIVGCAITRTILVPDDIDEPRRLPGFDS